MSDWTQYEVGASEESEKMREESYEKAQHGTDENDSSYPDGAGEDVGRHFHKQIHITDVWTW